MKIKKDAEPAASSDVYYDLFEGGYINPEDFLEKKDAAKVRDALNTIEEFIEEMKSSGLLEEM